MGPLATTARDKIMWSRSSVAILCAFLALVALPTLADEQQKIVPSDGSGDDWFGSAVAVWNDQALVAAPLDDYLTHTDAGTVYSFHFDGTSWVQGERLRSSDTASGDEFGTALAIDGNVAIIGSPYDDDLGQESGAAYIFRFDGTVWAEEMKLTAGDGNAGDIFGSAVSIDGDVAVVGSRLHDAIGFDSGSAYVYRYNGSSWLQEAKLTPSDNASFDYAAASVAVDGDVIALGAFGDDDLGSYSGSVYVYRYNGSQWIEDAKLTASDGNNDDWLGAAVALQPGLLVAGASRDELAGTGAGAAYVYRHDGTSWNEEQILRVTGASPHDACGASLGLGPDVVVLGVRGSDQDATDSGAAHVFRYDGRRWIEEDILTASDAEGGDNLGSAVAVHGSSILAGSPYDDDRGASSGGAYAYTTLPCRAGNVDAGQGLTRNVLFINGQAGDSTRTILVPVSNPLSITMSAAPAGPDPGAFVLYAWLGEPDDSTYSVQPYGLGLMCFPSFLSVGVPKPTVTWNNIGFPALLGQADFPSQPAPSAVLERNQGIRQQVTVTFQGFIQDQASVADGPGSITNAVILKTVP